MLASPLFTKKRGKCSSMKELSLYLNYASTSSITLSIQYRETSDDVPTQEKVKSRSKKVYSSLNLSIEKSSIFLNYKQIMPPKENRQLYQNSLKRKIIRYYLLRNERIIYLSEARSKMDMQEFLVASTDRALRESSLQIHSERKEFYRANQSSDHSLCKKDWLSAELEE